MSGYEGTAHKANSDPHCCKSGLLLAGNRVGLLYVSAVGTITQRLAAAVNLSKIVLHPLQLSSAPIPVGCGVGAILLAGLAYLCIKYSGHRLVPQKEYGSARWGTAADIAPFLHEKASENIPLTATESLSLAMKMPVTAENNYNRNKNVIVFGPSGSGKSTLLRCATMLEKMDGGDLSFLGEKAAWEENGKCVYANKKQLKEIRKNFGLVFQNFNLFPHYTVMKNIIDAPVCVDDVSKEEAKERAWKLLKQRGLSDKADAYPYQLSGGQQQRVSIARALALQPKVLFLTSRPQRLTRS